VHALDPRTDHVYLVARSRQRQVGNPLRVELECQYRTMLTVLAALEEIAAEDGQNDRLESSQDAVFVCIYDAVESFG